jgi:hypothetical protein
LPHQEGTALFAYGLAVDGSTVATWVGIGVTAMIGGTGVWQGAAANRRARRLEEAEFERSDVEWEWYFSSETDAWVIHNAGQDTAYEVTVTAEIDGTDFVGRAEEVPRRGEMSIDLSSFDIPEMRSDARERFDELSREGMFFGMTASFEIGHRITWRSKGGRWSSVVLPVETVAIE